MASVAAAIALLYAVFFLLGIGCPIRFLTGVSCFGCGMTRAWLSLLRLDLRGAFFFHPGFWIPPLALLFFLYKSKISIKFYKIFMFTAIALFVIIYFVRLFLADGGIVVFQPENGALCRLADKLLKFPYPF